MRFTRLRRFRLAGSVMVAASLALAVTAPASAARLHVRDLYFREGYERQVDSRTCTAASIAMMANFIIGQDLRLNQLQILRFSQANDALSDAVQRGSDPLGWSRGATAVTEWLRRPTAYAWAAYESERSALYAAAWSIQRYGKPVGLLTQHGRHAVVMTGFEATSNPTRSSSWTLLAVYVSDPLGSPHARYAPAGAAPLDQYRELDATRLYDRLWYGNWIVILPRS